MEPQTTIPAAANILGTIGTAAGVFSYYRSKHSGVRNRYSLTDRRIWHNWHRKSTDGLPGAMLMLWASCGVPFGVYAIVQNFNFALKFQPQSFCALTLVCWGQTLVYHNRWRTWTATLVTILVAATCAVIELILILTLRRPYQNGVHWPITLMAILASVMLAIGLIPPYFELAKRNGRVVGINFIFLTVDWFGAFFSLMALVAQNTFDVLGGSLYIVCMFLELGIFASQAIWLWRVRHVRREAKKAGKTYDAYIANHPTKKLARSPSSETVADLEAGHQAVETITTPEKCLTKPSQKSFHTAATITGNGKSDNRS
ncbi:hypothetical protein BDV96DRAFT_294295 [Lophiotrema nucula]|uniref:PQ loop repeat-domain-containing protein n=1 Tax=Lophiotrema nucula TaxID=690887 RepID=A0A6A5YL96_9PLEO|nr:hypothetical protein BDV96DRAFT_294295 [Lophiotrema nucula]